MKITAVVGVKDEVELIDACLAHLHRIGVSEIVVFDMGSTDGTLQRLHAHSREGALRLHELSDRDPKLLQRANELIQATLCSTASDWVIFQDADEFWIPASGNLADCVERVECELLSVPRYNVPVTPQRVCWPWPLAPSQYDRLWLFARKVPDLHRRLQSEVEVAWISGVPRPKIMARPGCIDGIRDGGHQAVPRAGRTVRGHHPVDLLIAHVPFTSFERFQRKRSNIAQYLRHRDDPSLRAWHWRRWDGIEEQLALRAEFERQLLTEEQLAALRTDATIRSAAEMLRTP
jgi:glycosyltransferase involved in cell wall biosynthesis